VLADRLNAQRVMEAEENPFLRAFYDGERGQHSKPNSRSWCSDSKDCGLDIGPRSHKAVIADFILKKTSCLPVQSDRSGTEIYNRYFNHFREQLPTPDLVIYLQASPDKAAQAIEEKNAPGEKAIHDDYLEEVIKAYEHFFFHYTSSDLLIVNTSEIDFRRAQRGFAGVAAESVDAY
jgi:deoxyadenosine/deoxycytidine kinase